MVLPKIEIEITADPTSAEAGLTSIRKAMAEADKAAIIYDASIRDVERSLEAGLITQKTAERATRQAEAAYERAAKDAAAYAGATAKVAAQSRKAGRAFGALSSASGQTRNQIQQVGFQVQDIAVQLQSGTSVATTLTQQLPQLAGAFGAVGAIVGTGLALGIPAVSVAMTALTGESITLEKRFEALSDASKAYNEAAEAASLTTRELGEEFGFAAERAAPVLDVLENLTRAEVVAQIESISEAMAEMFAVAGSGDQRSAIADFFDVNIFFAVGRAAREARDVARELTSEFRAAQQELAASSGDLRAQEAALKRLLSAAERLAQTSGDVTDEERELVRQIAEALLETQRLNKEFGEGTGTLQVIEELARSIGVAINIAADNTGALTEGFNNAADAAAAALENARALAGIIAEAEGRRGGGRGGDPRQFGFGAGDLAALQIAGGGGFRVDQDGRRRSGRRRGGGGGKTNPLIAELESVREALATEQELLDEAFSSQLETINKAYDQRLLSQEEFQSLSQRSAQEHADALAEIERTKQAAIRQDIAGAFGDLASLMQSENNKLFAIGKAAAIAEATVSGYQAAVSAWEKGMEIGGPPVAAAFTAASLARTGALISSIASQSVGGGGGGSAGGGAAPTTGGEGAGPTGASDGPLDVRLASIDPNAVFSGGSLQVLFDRLQDEAGDRGVRFLGNPVQ